MGYGLETRRKLDIVGAKTLFVTGLAAWGATVSVLGCTASLPAFESGASDSAKRDAQTPAPTGRDPDAMASPDTRPSSRDTAGPEPDATVVPPTDAGAPDVASSEPPPGSGQAPAIARPVLVDNNFTHACAVVAMGAEVWCWGDNDQGQLGRGSFGGGSTEPQKVMGIGPGQTPKVVSIATARETSCAAFEEGTVACWGANVHGELGSNGPRSAVPKKVPGLDDVVGLAAGEPTFCAVRGNGHVSCWGANQFLTAGVNGRDGISTPTEVKTAEGTPFDQVVEVAGGWQHTCALRQDGSLWCWGANTFGQLGQPPATLRSSAAPVRIAGVTPTSLGGLGHGHACIPTAEGKVLCWGKGGRLGRPVNADSATPIEVQGLTDVAAVDVGAEDTCALHRTGRVSCWGGDDYPSTPTELDIANARELAYGKHETCAVTQGASIWCWTGTRPARQVLPAR